MHAIKRTIVELQTKFQHAEIMETPAYGKLLVLDGRIQSSQAEDFIYHEALVHPGMLASERAPESGLVIGGGGGATPPAILPPPPPMRAGRGRTARDGVARSQKPLSPMPPGGLQAPPGTP